MNAPLVATFTTGLWVRILVYDTRTENPRVGGSIPPLATVQFSRLHEFHAVKLRRYGSS